MNHDLLKEDLDVTLKFCTDNHIFPFYGEILNVKEGMKPDFTIASDNLDNFLESLTPGTLISPSARATAQTTTGPAIGLQPTSSTYIIFISIHLSVKSQTKPLAW